MIGWFPRYSPLGVLTAEDATKNKWRAQWLREGEEIYDNGRELVINGVPSGHPTCNELSAAGGRWAAFRTDPVRVFTSDNLRIPGAGCPAITATHFAYVDDYASDIKSLILNGWAVARGGITDVRLSRQALVWSDNGRTWGLRMPGDPSIAAFPLQVATSEFRPIPIDTPDGPWVLNHTQTGIILRPFGEAHGYRFDNGGQTFYPDAVYINGVIHVAFSNERGEITELQFPLNAPRVDLRVPNSVPVIDKVPGPIATVNTTPEKENPVAERLPSNVRASINRYVAKWPVPSGGPNPADEAFEDRCRAWVRGLAAQVRFDVFDPNWGVKSAGGGRPQSKDSLTYNGPRLINYDMLLGVGTGSPTLIPDPEGADITGQVFMPVAAFDSVGNTPVVPQPPIVVQPTDVVPPAVDYSKRLDAIEAAIRDVEAILRFLVAAQPPAAPPAVKFPKYKGTVKLSGAVTLDPVVEQ